MKTVLIPTLVAGLLIASCLMYAISLRVRSVLAVTMPDRVRLGDDFVARLTLRNVESSEMTLDHFSIDSKHEANFADGITVVSSQPPYQESRNVGKEEKFTFNAPVKPDDAFRAEFVMRPTRPGEFSGWLFADVLLPGKSGTRHTRPVLIRVRVDGECR